MKFEDEKSYVVFFQRISELPSPLLSFVPDDVMSRSEKEGDASLKLVLDSLPPREVMILSNRIRNI